MSTSSSPRAYDVVVFGASGFTGQYVALDLAREVMLKNKTRAKKDQLKIAIAGRNQAKLESILHMVHEHVSMDIPILLADATDAQSMFQLCAQARVILNCTGPFRFYGEKVVQACIQTATNYLDITGEPDFIERMVFKYHDAAVKNNVVILHACGFDSIPSEMGTVFTCDQLVQHDPTIVPTGVEAFIDIQGESAHYTTYQCIVEGLANVRELQDLRKKTRSVVEYASPVALPKRILGYEPRLNKYAIRFPGADASIVRRSQVEHTKRHPDQKAIRFSVYLVNNSCLYTILMACWGVFLQLMIWIPFEYGKQFLLDYPRLCTAGTFSHEGPSQQVLDASTFSTTFFGQGMSSNQELVRVQTKVSGPEAGYVATPIMINECAFRVLEHDLNCAQGVITTASAFRGTKLIPELNRRGLRFDVVQKPTTESLLASKL